MELLKELCDAAEICFQDYNVKLARAVFLLAWGVFMHISEYSRTYAKAVNKHNIREKGILLLDNRASVNFISDMVAKGKDPPKHRLVEWSFLPEYAKSFIEDYNEARPQGAENYFCRQSGEPLTRTDILNLLEPCLLNTTWCFLSVPPHSFRLGVASVDRVHGIDILELRLRRHWGEKSKAIEAYTRPDIVVLPPEKIWQDLPHYRRTWRDERLLYICRNVVETKGKDDHPHMVMMKKFFPQVGKKYKEDFPLEFPFPRAEAKRQSLKKARLSTEFLKKIAKKRIREEQAKARRSNLAQVLCTDVQNRIKAAALGSGRLTAARILQVDTAIAGSHLQSDRVQTDIVRIVSEEDWQLLQQVKSLQTKSSSRQIKQQESDCSEQDSPLFKVKIGNDILHLTRQEIKELQLQHPTLHSPSVSIASREKDQLKKRIRRHISKKYRRMKDTEKARWLLKKKGYTGKDLPEVPRIKQNSTIKSLVEFFCERVLQFGVNKGMPVEPEESNPEKLDEEFREKVLKLYLNKSLGYEADLSHKKHSRALAKGDQKIYSQTVGAKVHQLLSLRQQATSTQVLNAEGQVIDLSTQAVSQEGTKNQGESTENEEQNDQKLNSGSSRGIRQPKRWRSKLAMASNQGSSEEDQPIPPSPCIKAPKRKLRKRSKVEYKVHRSSSQSEEDF